VSLAWELPAAGIALAHPVLWEWHALAPRLLRGGGRRSKATDPRYSEGRVTHAEAVSPAIPPLRFSDVRSIAAAIAEVRAKTASSAGLEPRPRRL